MKLLSPSPAQSAPLAAEAVPAGNPESLDRLEPLRPGLFVIALRSLGTQEAAEEAVQETLARAVVAIGRGQPHEPGKLPAFVAGIARHVITDMIRLRMRAVPLATVPEGAHRSEDNALDSLISAADRVAIRSALDALSPADRELLRLCYYEGLTPLEVAARTGEPAERIRKRKSRALDRLREALHGGHDGAPKPTMSEGQNVVKEESP